MIFANIDTSRFIDKMNSLHAALIGAGQDGDAQMLVRDEARRLSRAIVNVVPPLRKDGNPRQVGEKAVERDIKNLVSEAKPELIDEIVRKFGPQNIRTGYVTEADGKHLNIQWDHVDQTGANLAALHEQYKNRRGRIPKRKSVEGTWASRVVVPLGARAPFIKQVQKHVGHWKATWAKLGSLLGDNYPRWINHHFNSPYCLADLKGLENAKSPFVKFGSKAPGNFRLKSAIQQTINSRARAMSRRIKLILAGYNKDLSKGMKAQKHAHDYSEPLPPVE